MDNVDNLVDSFYYGKPNSTKNGRKCGKMRNFWKGGRVVLCKWIIHEKIHMFMQHQMLINMWIMWITLFGKQIFPDFKHISCPHSYQQVPVHTFF